MFHSWPRLPMELKVLILEHALQDDASLLRATPLYHEWFMRREPWSWIWYTGRIDAVIRTRNRELVELALDSCGYLFLQTPLPC